MTARIPLQVAADIRSLLRIEGSSNDDIIQRKSGAWTNRTMAQLVDDLVSADLAGDLVGDNTLVTNGTWTPVFTCTTPGDLSVSYATRTGTYCMINERLVWLYMHLRFTPTFTTATGDATVTGLPEQVITEAAGSLIDIDSDWTQWGNASRTSITCSAESNEQLYLIGNKENLNRSKLDMSNMTSGNEHRWETQMVYRTAL